MNRRTKCKTNYVLLLQLLHGFIRLDLLDKHKDDCKKNQTQGLTFPEDTTVKFKGKAKQQKVPFIIYVDFECYTTKICDGKKYQHHVPNSFGYVVVNAVPHLTTPPVNYRGKNVIEVFLEKLMEEGENE